MQSEDVVTLLRLFERGHWCGAFDSRGRARPVAGAMLALAVTTAGCQSGAGTTEPTTTAAEPTITETFRSVLPVGGSRFYSFAFAGTGPVDATLTEIGGDGVPPTVIVYLGIGTPEGTTCTASTSPVQVSGEAQITTQVSQSLDPGTYCVLITDTGNLFAPATFAVSIVHP